ncbi:hypothetical protein [Nocardiopsis sp. JB363]|uniref:hypothetical protein n=1 Tax=Nocardiopsis sp. JB363 TaxID=1434837 RepID=UPI001F1E6084|nr:hypothetical protein [Nocardiopsis sp. JB363]
MIRSESPPTSWHRTYGDAVVGPALRLMDEDPARRFTALVGRPPITYLREQRRPASEAAVRTPRGPAAMPFGAVVGSMGQETVVPSGAKSPPRPCPPRDPPQGRLRERTP